MIYLTSQPDDSYFIWQLLTLGDNMEELDIPKEDIYHLVGYTGNVNVEWDHWKDKVYGNVVFVPDTRVSKSYLVSIRPNIIKQFLKINPDLNNEYIFYHDADILFADVPLFEGMEDGRVHVSRTSYLDHEYIASKRSPTLMRDLLRCVDIDEETIRINQRNTGGAQIYAKGLNYNYWDKVEKDCEKMQEFYFKSEQHINEKGEHRIVYTNQEIYKAEYNKQEDEPDFNFQHWTFEMWSMLWNQWYSGLEVYANPALHFSWPVYNIADWNKSAIFHNSGIVSANPVENESDAEKQQREIQNANWFDKGNWKNTFPTNFSAACELGIVDNQVAYGCQLNYLSALRRSAYKHWLKEEVLTSYYLIYDQSDNIEQYVVKYNEKPQPKDFIILNTSSDIIEIDQIRVVNVNSPTLDYIRELTFGILKDIKDV